MHSLLLALIALLPISSTQSSGDTWQTYCQAKTGCKELTCYGSTNINELFSFNIIGPATGGEPAFFIHALYHDNKPFMGGTLCLRPPVVRKIMPPNGNLIINVYTVTEMQLLTDTNQYLQIWYRNFNHPDGTGVCLTNAVQFWLY